MKPRETRGWIQKQIKATTGTLLLIQRFAPQNKKKHTQPPRTATTAINAGQSIWSFISVNFMHTEVYKIAGTFQSFCNKIAETIFMYFRINGLEPATT